MLWHVSPCYGTLTRLNYLLLLSVTGQKSPAEKWTLTQSKSTGDVTNRLINHTPANSTPCKYKGLNESSSGNVTDGITMMSMTKS